MEITHYVALHSQSLQLWDSYFIGVTHAPAMYLTLGRSVETVAFALEHLCMEASHPNSRIAMQIDSRHSAEKIIWLALYRLSASLHDVEHLLRRLSVTKDKQPQWWLNFAQKTRFGHQESFTNLIQRLDFHVWALRMTLKTCNRELLDRKLETFTAWAGALEIVLQQQLTSTAYANEGASIRTASDLGGDVIQEFIAFSDYHDGRDIFEAANIMTIVRLAMYWTHRGVDALVCVEKTKSPPIQAYANILKAGWILQRLHLDQRARSEECTAIIISLSEDVVFELKRINELKVALPTNEQLVQEADLRIWLDDLEETETEKRSSDETMPAPAETLVDTFHRTAPPREERGYVAWQRSSQEMSKPTVGTQRSSVAQRSSIGSDTQGIAPSQSSATETVMRSPDSRTTNTTLASSIDAQQSAMLSHHSSLSSTSSNPARRKPLTRAPLPTVTEPLERREQQEHREPLEHRELDPRETVARTKPPTPSLQRNSTLSPSSMQYGVPPLHTYSSSRDIAQRAKKAEEQSLPNANTGKVRPLARPTTIVSDLEIYDPSNPPSNFGSHSQSSNHDYLPLSPMPDLRDFSERPGEVEIMKDCFKSMILSASDSFEIHPVWESCSIRIFRKADNSVRILTFRDSGIDQRIMFTKDTEIVPEYGYHKDVPVVYLRKMCPDYQSQSPSIHMGAQDLSAASLYYRFDNARDMFNFQLAFTGEAVEIDIKAVRTVRFKRNLLDGEHSNYKARLQLWREQPFQTIGSVSSASSLVAGSIAGTIRSQGVVESMLKVPSTRLVIFFEDVIVVLFVTDSVAIEARARTNVIRIKPSSYRTFGNPSSVRARFLGTREQSGGMRLDKKGLNIDSEDSFDEFKWFEIDFYSEEEMSYFRNDFCTIINERRKERRRVEELKRLAANGVRSSR